MVPPPPKPPVICHDLAERSRLAHQAHSMLEDKLDKIRVEINSLKQQQDKIVQSHGLGHSSAFYIQKLEDKIKKMENQIQRLGGENERLRQKNDQMLASRKHEEIKYTQHLRECQRLNKVPLIPTSTPIQARKNKASTTFQLRRNNSQGSSSTVSITSSGSSTRKSPPTSSLSTIDDGTLEISAQPFFEKMEDETMLNVNNLMNRMRSTVEDLVSL